LKSSFDAKVGTPHPKSSEPINCQFTISRPTPTAIETVASGVCVPDFDPEVAESETLKHPEKVLLGKRPAEELTAEQV